MMTLRGDALIYLWDRPYQMVSLEELAEFAGCTTTQMKETMSTLRYDNEMYRRSIEVVLRARAWRYRPEFDTTRISSREHASDTHESMDTGASIVDENVVFEQVGMTHDGKPLLRCEDGRFYRAEEV